MNSNTETQVQPIKSKENLINWTKIILPSILLAYFLSLAPPPDLEREGYVVLVVFVYMFVLWVLKPIHYTIVAILGLVLMSSLGVGKLAEIASGFSSDATYFLTAVLLVGYAVHITGLGKNIALIIISKCNNKLSRLVLATPFMVLTMALLVPSAVARATIMHSIYKEISDHNISHQQNKKNFNSATMLAIGPLNPVASITYLSGSAAPLIAAEIIFQFTGFAMSWLKWLLLIGVPYFFLFGMLAIYLYFRYPIKDSLEASSQFSVEAVFLTLKEKKLLIVLAGMVSGWVMGSYVDLPAVVPAIIGAIILFLPGVDILTERDIRKINWELLIFNGAIVSFAYLLATTGAIMWLSDLIYSIISPLQFSEMALIIFFSVILTIFRFFFFNNISYLAAVLPVVLTAGPMLNINGVVLAFIAVFASSIVFLPMQSLSAMIVLREKNFNTRDIFSFGIAIVVCYLVIVPIAMQYLWPR